MCGRFSLIYNLEELKERFRIQQIKLSWNPRYNIAPTQDVLAVFEDSGELVADSFTWGLVPHWAKEARLGGLINARAESADEKPSFRESFKNRRCLILASGFFEWRKFSGGKQPYFIKLKSGDPFAFAGLFDIWHDELKTCTILTTKPNAVVKPIHERMPVILSPESENSWLEFSDVDSLKKLLTPYPPEEMEAYPISKEVNNPETEGSTIIERIQLKGDVSDQKNLFDYT
ncbi:MAG: SOS response-associated peptidase [Methanobacteriota archaeon]